MFATNVTSCHVNLLGEKRKRRVLNLSLRLTLADIQNARRIDLKVAKFRVNIDQDKCVGCGACVKACVYGVLEIIDDLAYPTDVQSCKGCQECVQECEMKAIQIVHL